VQARLGQEKVKQFVRLPSAEGNRRAALSHGEVGGES